MTTLLAELQTNGRLLIATHNAGKLVEIRDLLAPRGIAVVSAADFDLPEPVEDGDTFAANAAIKAQAALKATGLTALSDDSGLAVEALAGAPGIRSARWAGPAKNFRAAMERVEAGLAGQDNRRAVFIAMLCLVTPEGHESFYEGRVEGQLVWPPRGNGGFGYDPMFQPDGETRTFGEMAPEEKHELSHRARAIKLFLAALDPGA